MCRRENMLQLVQKSGRESKQDAIEEEGDEGMNDFSCNIWNRWLIGEQQGVKKKGRFRDEFDFWWWGGEGGVQNDTWAADLGKWWDVKEEVRHFQHASPNNLCYPAKQLRKLIRPQLDFETQVDVLSIKIRTNLQVKNEEWYLTDVTHLVSCWVSCALNVILTGRLKCHSAASGCCWSWGSVGPVGSLNIDTNSSALWPFLKPPNSH